MSCIELTAYPGSILGPIAKILGWVMNGVYNVVNSLFGIESVTLSIIIITIIIYMCLLPLLLKQQKYSKLSQKMQPEISAIQQKYKGKKDPDSLNAMNQETQLIYQKYGVSPMGTCLPMLIQFPILLALYQVFRNIPAYITSIKEYYGIAKGGDVVSNSLVDIISNTTGYQDKLTQLASDYKISLSGIDLAATNQANLNNYIVDILYKLPKSGWENLTSYFDNIGGAVDSFIPHLNQFNYLFRLNISDNPWNIITTSFTNSDGRDWMLIILALMIPVLSYATQMISIRLMPINSANQDDNMVRQMKTMNTVMPLFSLFLVFTVPVGLGIYWIFSAVVKSIQQFFINKHFEKLDLDEVIAKNQEKARKRREKMGISESQFRQAAQMNTRSIGNKANLSTGVSEDEGESELENASALKENANPGSLAAKANLVREFNEKNSRK